MRGIGNCCDVVTWRRFVSGDGTTAQLFHLRFSSAKGGYVKIDQVDVAVTF